jgi:hypothetical protein
MLDALKQIGGPEARAAMLQTLQTTARPVEILELSKNLEQEAPGMYREQILNAARESLEMAQANQLGSDVELGPAYRVLDVYGGVHEHAQTDPVLFHTAIAMANLPDGSGAGPLLALAQNQSPDAWGRAIATEMVAQLATQNDQARAGLVQMAQQQQISDRIWQRVASILGGEQYQLGTVGTEGSADARTGTSPEGVPMRSYTVVNAATTPEQIAQRIGLIDQFLGIVAQNSTAAAALQQQRLLLAGRLEQ